ncbi:MAG: carboxy terminal-processing peptidase [Arhodomonas sp.]|nr:carboxy terminal-processing peptidase [Arhodomonas sp.]
MVNLERFGLDSEQPTGRLKMTVAKFYGSPARTPAPRRGTGCGPAHGCRWRAGERDTDNPLPWDEIRAVDYRRGPGALPIAELRERHAARMDSDPAMRALAREVSHRTKEQRADRVSLDEEVRRERAEQARAARLEAVNRQLEAMGREPVARPGRAQR